MRFADPCMHLYESVYLRYHIRLQNDPKLDDVSLKVHEAFKHWQQNKQEFKNALYIYSSSLVPMLQMSPAGRSWNWTILNLSSNTRYSGNFPIIVILIHTLPIWFIFYLGIEQPKVLAFVYGFKHQTWIMKFLYT